MEFIDLHNIFKDNSVISSIPNYLNNLESPSFAKNIAKQLGLL